MIFPDLRVILPAMSRRRKRTVAGAVKPEATSGGVRPLRFLWILVLAIMLLVPVAWVKYLLGCCVVVLVGYSLPVTKNAAGAWLGVLFMFAYLLSPYWLMISDYEKTGLIRFMPQILTRIWHL